MPDFNASDYGVPVSHPPPSSPPSPPVPPEPPPPEKESFDHEKASVRPDRAEHDLGTGQKVKSKYARSTRMPNPLRPVNVLSALAALAAAVGHPIPPTFHRTRVHTDEPMAPRPPRTNPGDMMPSAPKGWSWASAIIDSGSSVDSLRNPSVLTAPRRSRKRVQVADVLESRPGIPEHPA